MGCNNDYCDIDMNENVIGAADRDVPKMAYYRSVEHRGGGFSEVDLLVWCCPVCDGIVTCPLTCYDKSDPPDGAYYCKVCGQRLKYPEKKCTAYREPPVIIDWSRFT